MTKKVKIIYAIAIITVLTVFFALPSSASTGLSESTVNVGKTVTATVDALSGTTEVTWSCIPNGIVSFGTETSGSSVYSVKVEGKLPGTATIRAVVTDASGNTATTTVGTIQVILPDGIYTVRNNYTDQTYSTDMTYYLRSQLTNASTSPVSLVQHSQNYFGDFINKMYSYWRIIHLGNGEYMFRSVANGNQALNYSSSTLSITTISSTTPDSAKWIIQGNNIKPKSNTSKCLGLASTTPATAQYTDGSEYSYFNLQVGTIGDMAFEKWTFGDDTVISDRGITNNAKYYIMNANSERYMTLASETEANVIAISTSAKSNANHFQWTVQKPTDYRYRLTNNIGTATKVMTSMGSAMYIYKIIQTLQIKCLRY